VETKEWKIVHYLTADDHDPFDEWTERIEAKMFDKVTIRLKLSLIHI